MREKEWVETPAAVAALIVTFQADEVMKCIQVHPCGPAEWHQAVPPPPKIESFM